MSHEQVELIASAAVHFLTSNEVPPCCDLLKLQSNCNAFAVVTAQQLGTFGLASGVSTGTVTTDPPQLVPELINDALSIL